MYTKVVVPLDGSKLAELALPHLEIIGKGCSIPQVFLVSVTEKIKGSTVRGTLDDTYVPERPVGAPLPTVGTSQSNIIFNTHTYGTQEIPMTLGKMAKTAADYLCRIGEDLETKGFQVTSTVLMGNPAEQITRYAAEQSADLIIMASYGKTGIGRWNMSNISARIIKDTCIPLLLIRPGPDFKETKPKRKGVAM